MQISVLGDVASNCSFLSASGLQPDEGEFDQTMSQVIALLKQLPPGLTRSCPGRENPPAGAPSRLNLPGQAFLPGVLAEFTAVKKQAAVSEGSRQAGEGVEGDSGKNKDSLADLLAEPALLQNALAMVSFIEKETGIEPGNLSVKAMINGSGQVQFKVRITQGAVQGEVQTLSEGLFQPDENTPGTSAAEDGQSIYSARPLVKTPERNRVEILKETPPNNILREAQPEKNSGREVQTPSGGSFQPDENTSGTSAAEYGQSIYSARPLVKTPERNRVEILEETLPNNILGEAQPEKNSGLLAAETAKNVKQKVNAAEAGKTASPAENALFKGEAAQLRIKPLVQPGDRLGEVQTPPAGSKPGLAVRKSGKQGEKSTHIGADVGKSGILPPGVAKRFTAAVEDGPPVSSTGPEGKTAVQSASPLPNSTGNEPLPSGSQKGIALADLPGRLVQEFKHVANTRKDRLQTEVELKLEPEHLGKLMVKLFIDKGALSVHFFTGNSNVKEALEASMQQLRESFVQHDLKLNEAFVFVGDGNRGNAGGHYERGNSNLAFHGSYNRQEAGEYQPQYTDSFSPETASGGVNCLV